MGTVDTRPDRQYGAEQLFLLPDQIQVDERYNVRGYGEGEDCNGDLHALADSIERDGQLDAAIVRVDGMRSIRADNPERYILVAGHRRRRAIALINERRTAEGKPLLRLRVIVDCNGDPLRKAIVSNLHRKDFSPMDLARLIARIRKEYKWEMPTTTLQVAKYLGMSTQKVREHERFLHCDKLIQDRLHQGVLSWHSAVELLRDGKVPQNRVSEVIERAQDIQAEVEAQKPASRRGSRIEAPSVKKAMREVQEQEDDFAYGAVRATGYARVIKGELHLGGKKVATVSRSRKEILDWIESLDGPAVRPEMRKWARYFVDVWAPGRGSDSALRARLPGLYLSAKAKKK